jgi:hypothetical protein
MPNGGFGCAYCQFYTTGKCNLRGAKITSDHWTVCANITFMEGGPTRRVADLLGYKPLDTSGVEAKGSIYTIGTFGSASEGYSQVPWLENQEIMINESAFLCSVCSEIRRPSKYINWKGVDVHFCSYDHYLVWRSERISSGDAVDDDVKGRNHFSHKEHFSSLEVIDENTTQEQRERALKRDFWRRVFRGLRNFAFLLAVFSIFVRILDYYF